MLKELDPSEVCYIDEETARSLELVENGVDNYNRRDTLLGYLNKTCTSTGYRMLREEILQPLAHVNTLEHRLDCVQHFLDRCDSHALIIRELAFFGRGVDLDRIVPNLVSLASNRGSSLKVAEKRLEIIASLHSILSRVPILTNALAGIDCSLLNVYKESLQDSDYETIFNELLNVIDFDQREVSKNRRNRVLSIKSGVNELFDVARNTYRDAINNLEAYVHELQVEDHLPWKLSYSEAKGYLLTLSSDKVLGNVILSPKYIRVVRTRTMITCSTVDMVRSNVRANISYENSMKLANEELVSLLETVLGYVGAINKLVEIIGRLDLISSLAKLALDSGQKLVRPRFCNQETIIEESRHPVLEKILDLDKKQIVPNDVCLSTSNGNLCLITGPNMGGKSVYLKQIALIQIMAQIGSFIPAKKAAIKPMNRIVVRVGSTDDGQSSSSSFMSEMKGISTALMGNSRLNSLYIIDELGRGTTIDDGTAYSLAIAEELALRRDCFTLFATHFPVLVNLQSLVGNIRIFQFEINETAENKMCLTHNLIPGHNEKFHYGIELAASCGLPDEIISEAKKCIGL